MSIAITLVAYAYDRVMRRYRRRWIMFWIALTAIILAAFLVSDHPLHWVLNNLILNSQTGWYRLMIWDAALAKISDAPLTGFAFADLLNSVILDNTIDFVWLVLALRFGVPVVIFLFLANVTAFLPTKQSKHHDFYIDQMRPAFTMMLVMFMFNGLTVHFWNYMLIFWGLCIGIRASLREW